MCLGDLLGKGGELGAGRASISYPVLAGERCRPGATRVSCWWRRGEAWVRPGEAGVTPQGDARTNNDSQPRRQIGAVPFFNSLIRIFRPVGFVTLPSVAYPAQQIIT